MSRLTGTGRLIRLAARRDRVQLPIWIAGSAVVMAAGASAAADQFPTEAARVAALRDAGGNATVLLLRGIPVGTGEGAMLNFRNLTSMLVVAALMSTFAVVRHTRQNEEAGRAELIGATGVGRFAGLTAALALATGANVVLGLVLAGTLMAGGLPAAGSLALGAAVAVTGTAFAGIAGLAAQLFQSARAANACAATAVGVAYLVRGVGDALGERAPDGVQVTSGWPVWLSPMGWAQQVRPYGEERWWALALPVALLVVLAAGAFALLSRRDLGAGLVPDRPGPADAPRALLSPAGLAWRLNRASVIGWVIGAAVAGAGVGSLGDAVNEAMSDDEGTADMLGQLAGTGAGSLVDSYYAAMMNVFGVLAAGFVVQALLRLRGEEAGGTAEAVLATAVGRFRWTAAHLVCTVAGAAAMLLAAGAAAGVADAVVGGDAGVGTLIGAGLVQLPAALAVAGFVLLAFGGLPRLTVALAWAGLTFSIVCGLLGDLFGLPQAVRDLSPFSHVPAIPAADPAVVPLLALVAVAAVLAAAGMSLFRRRDLTA